MKHKDQIIGLDLRGVKCPLSWARAKVRLENLRNGEMLEVLLDDPRGARDLPAAAEAEGYSVAESETLNGLFRIRIEK